MTEAERQRFAERCVRAGLVAQGLRQGLVADSVSGKQEISRLAARIIAEYDAAEEAASQ